MCCLVSFLVYTSSCASNCNKVCLECVWDTSIHRGLGYIVIIGQIQRLHPEFLQGMSRGLTKGLHGSLYVLLPYEQCLHHALCSIYQVSEWHLGRYEYTVMTTGLPSEFNENIKITLKIVPHPTLLFSRYWHPLVFSLQWQCPFPEAIIYIIKTLLLHVP